MINKIITSKGGSGGTTYSAGTGLTLGGTTFTLNQSGASALGGIYLAGDLGGAYSAPTVVGLQGHGVSSGAPSTGHGLYWNGSVWLPGYLADANIASTAAIPHSDASNYIQPRGTSLSVAAGGSIAIPTSASAFGAFSVTGTPASDVTLTLTATTGTRLKIFNACGLGSASVFSPGGYWIPPGQEIEIWWDGAAWQGGLTSVQLAGTLTLHATGAITTATATWKIPAGWCPVGANMRVTQVVVGGGTAPVAGMGTDSNPVTNGVDLVATNGTPAVSGVGSIISNNTVGSAGGISGNGIQNSQLTGQLYNPGTGAAFTVYFLISTTAATTTDGILSCTLDLVQT